MTGIVVLIRIFIVFLVVSVILYILVPDLFKSKTKKLTKTDLDDIEQESIDILNKKEEIRGVTKETQNQINNINKNLEK